MKKSIFLGLFLVLCVPVISFAAFDSNLKYGSSGSAVKEMQEFLVDQGVCSITPSGNFFALTLKCVKAFQEKEGVFPASGYWGPITRAKATEKLDLTASEDDEKVQTGTVAQPASSDFDKLLAVLLALKTSQEAQTVQIQTQTQVQQQIAQNLGQNVGTPAPIPEPTPVVEDNTPKEVTLADLVIAVSVQQIHTDRAEIIVNNTIKGDHVVLTFEGKEYNLDLWTLDESMNAIGFSLSSGNTMPNVIGYSLNPDTSYSYKVKIERGNKYAIATGTFKTLAE